MRRTYQKALLVLAMCTGVAGASVLDDLGYNTLKSEKGGATPTGAGTAVAHIEANNGVGYFPENQTHPVSGLFARKNFTFVTATGAPAITISGHAQTVGLQYYGALNSLSPGVTNITAYSLEGWREKVLHAGSSLQPSLVPARVSNHSYLDTYAVVPKLDWLAQTDDLVNVVAVGNDFNADSLGLPGAFNGISIGVLSGKHVSGTDASTAPYTASRVAPLLVVPADLTSYAAPSVSSAAASLIQYAHTTTSISNGSYNSPRSGAKIYHAETAEVIKAALLAGADRKPIAGYSVNSSNGLNTKFGAGEANIYSSYHILAGGEQNSVESGRSSNIGRFGFDYEPSFSQNESASYTFSGDLTRNGIVASLAWNAKIAGGTASNFDASATLYKFKLMLFDQNNLATPIAQSASTTENTQNLYVKGLQSRHKYLLKVVPQSGQGNFTWDYGLAWRLTPADKIIDSDNHGLYTLLRGDSTGDGKVDTLDVNTMVSKFGLQSPIWDDGDFNEDGHVDSRDFNSLASNFGATSAALPLSASLNTSASAAGAIGMLAPEPGSMGALLLGMCGMLRRRSRRSVASSRA
jgi:hypothetical protein